MHDAPQKNNSEDRWKAIYLALCLEPPAKKMLHVVEGQSQQVVGDVATSQGEVLVTPPPFDITMG